MAVAAGGTVTATEGLGSAEATGRTGKGGGPSWAGAAACAVGAAEGARKRASMSSKIATLLSKLETLVQSTMTKIGKPKVMSVTSKNANTSMTVSVGESLTLSMLSYKTRHKRGIAALNRPIA
ncbi:MAG: hypothetical protein RL492_413 [Verrucomicrobiota bacterium]|jgi:hypothetical protein